MKISSIQNYNRYNNKIVNQKPISHINMSQPADMFIKSPSFQGAEYNMVSPFFRDGIEYTSKNLKKFNQVMESIDFKNRKDGLLESLTNAALLFLRDCKKNENQTFALDFLLREGTPDSFEQLCRLNINAVYDSLPKIKFPEEIKQNVISLLNIVAQCSSYILGVYHDAIDNENVPLLKTLIQDNNWQCFKFNRINDYGFQKQELKVIRKGQQSENPEIKELFNGKNLYNLLKQYDYIYSTVGEDADAMFDLGMVYLYETTDEREFRQKAENIAYRIIEHSYFSDKSAYLSEIPFTKCESIILQENFYSDKVEAVKKAIKIRVEKIIQRNGIDTPKQILACLNDRVMTPELLTVYNKDFTLLDKIAEMPVSEESKPIISKIVEKLSQTKIYPDNDAYRRAALKAAKQGNLELLKFFESKHIHFANELNEPLSDFPEVVRDTLKNAKTNNAALLEYANFPQFINNYLQKNSNVDINSRNQFGESLLSRAIQLNSLETLEILAKRDDVDWNITDNNGENILMQLLDKTENSDLNFKKKVIELLRKLPEGKFDINYINTQCVQYRELPYTALSKIFTYFGLHWDLLDDILKFKDIDTNLDPLSSKSLLLHSTVLHDAEIFKAFFLHPNTDISLIKNEKLEELKKQDVRIDPEILRFLANRTDELFAKNMLNRYEENGVLSLEEIKEFVSYENFQSIANTKFNIFGENIAHVLVDIFPDITNPEELKIVSEIVETLHKKRFDFQIKDELDRTPLDKAIEGENKVMATILGRYQ